VKKEDNDPSKEELFTVALAVAALIGKHTPGYTIKDVVIEARVAARELLYPANAR
jgi:hypothetical protein